MLLLIPLRWNKQGNLTPPNETFIDLTFMFYIKIKLLHARHTYIHEQIKTGKHTKMRTQIYTSN